MKFISVMYVRAADGVGGAGLGTESWLFNTQAQVVCYPHAKLKKIGPFPPIIPPNQFPIDQT